MPELIKPLPDEEVWEQSKWLIDEMQHGMCLYEGWIPSVTHESLVAGLHYLASTIGLKGFASCNDSTEGEEHFKRSLDDCLERFVAGKDSLLIANYSLRRDAFDFVFQLMCFANENSTSDIEVICYREGLQPWHEAKERFIASLQHQRELRRDFNGKALFIGPDGSDYPVLHDAIPKGWIRAE